MRAQEKEKFKKLKQNNAYKVLKYAVYLVRVVEEIEAKNDFLGKNQFFEGDLKISFFSPQY